MLNNFLNKLNKMNIFNLMILHGFWILIQNFLSSFLPECIQTQKKPQPNLSMSSQQALSILPSWYFPTVCLKQRVLAGTGLLLASIQLSLSVLRQSSHLLHTAFHPQDSFLLFPLPTQKAREKTKHRRSTRSCRTPRRVSSQSGKCFLSNQVSKAN